MTDQRLLDSTLARFSIAMKQRLRQKRVDGWRGWNEAENVRDGDEDGFLERAIRNARDGDYIDAANLLMFLWNLGLQRTAPPPEQTGAGAGATPVVASPPPGGKAGDSL